MPVEIKAKCDETGCELGRGALTWERVGDKIVLRPFDDGDLMNAMHGNQIPMYSGFEALRKCAKFRNAVELLKEEMNDDQDERVQNS